MLNKTRNWLGALVRVKAASAMLIATTAHAAPPADIAVVGQHVLEAFETRMAGSRRLSDQAKQFIPGGVQHNLAFNHPFSLAVARAEGAHLWDVDGNRYIDFLQAGGPTVLIGG